MAYNYIDTPRTDAGDRTHLTAANISFSEVQGYPSPSKNPSNALINGLRAQRSSGGALKTPRARDALATLRNGPSVNNEFTPLLKSAAPYRYRGEAAARRSSRKTRDEMGKENGTDELVNSMLAASAYGQPRTPAYLRVGYREDAGVGARTPGVTLLSSVSPGGGQSQMVTPGSKEVVDSSTLMSTPIPDMATGRDCRARGDQGNVLTLRAQEAVSEAEGPHGRGPDDRLTWRGQKLEKLDKENFNLKLKIHFLDDALKRTGTDYQQGMIKENTELKMDKTTLTHEIRQQQRSLSRAEKELDEYRRQLREYAERVKRRHTDETVKEELEALRQASEENKALAEKREEEAHELRRRLELADAGSDDRLQDLKDDVADLEQELRAREAESDDKDEEIEALKEKLGKVEENDELEVLRRDLVELEKELEEKDALVSARDAALADLQAQARSGIDREKSSRKLRGDVDALEADVREKAGVIDAQHEELRALQKRLASAEKESTADLQALRVELRDARRAVEDKDGEIVALEERLQTARGSWDKEAQVTDARLQEKDEATQDKEREVRALKRVVDDKEDEIKLLMDNLEKSQAGEREARAMTEKQDAARGVQVSELQDRLRKANEELDRVVDRDNAELTKVRDETRTAEAEISRLREALGASGSPTKKDALINEQAARLAQLEYEMQTAVDKREVEIKELERQLTALKHEVQAQQVRLKIATPSRGQHEVIKKMQVELDRLREDKEGLDDEIIVLEHSLDEAQQEKMKLQTTVMELQKDLLSRSPAKDVSTPGRDRSAAVRARVTSLEQRCEDYRQQVEVLEAQLAKASRGSFDSTTPGRDRGELKAKLAVAKGQIVELQMKVAELELQRDEAREETGSGERRDLHNMLRDAQIEVENLHEQLAERDTRLAGLLKKDGETRAQLVQARGERDQGAVEVVEQGVRIEGLLKREQELRRQIRGLKDARYNVDDLEVELEQRQGSSSTHARNEAQLRTELRDAKATVDELQRQLRQRDDRVQAGVKEGDEVGERLKRSRPASDGTETFGRDLQGQTASARLEVEALEARLRDREWKLQTSLKRETELRSRLKATGGSKTQPKALATVEKTHERELRGLSKQIQFLDAKCRREQSFRQDLVFVKKWFTLQVEMYSACNKADLKLLEDMGVHPDVQFRQKRPSLKAAGLVVMASLRMKRMQMEWRGNQKLHESLMRKLQGMKS